MSRFELGSPSIAHMVMGTTNQFSTRARLEEVKWTFVFDWRDSWLILGVDGYIKWVSWKWILSSRRFWVLWGWHQEKLNSSETVKTVPLPHESSTLSWKSLGLQEQLATTSPVNSGSLNWAWGLEIRKWLSSCCEGGGRCTAPGSVLCRLLLSLVLGMCAICTELPSAQKVTIAGTRAEWNCPVL